MVNYGGTAKLVSVNKWLFWISHKAVDSDLKGRKLDNWLKQGPVWHCLLTHAGFFWPDVTNHIVHALHVSYLRNFFFFKFEVVISHLKWLIFFLTDQHMHKLQHAYVFPQAWENTHSHLETTAPPFFPTFPPHMLTFTADAVELCKVSPWHQFTLGLTQSPWEGAGGWLATCEHYLSSALSTASHP